MVEPALVLHGVLETKDVGDIKHFYLILPKTNRIHYEIIPNTIKDVTLQKPVTLRHTFFECAVLFFT